MTVPVFIDGAGPFWFVVDTGANRSVVSRELAASLALPASGRVDVHGIAGVEPAALARVRRFRVGDVSSVALAMPALPRARQIGSASCRARVCQDVEASGGAGALTTNATTTKHTSKLGPHNYQNNKF